MFIRDITFSHKRKPTRVLHDKNLEHDFQFNYAFCFVNTKYTPWKSCPATYAYTMYYYKDYNQAIMLEYIRNNLFIRNNWPYRHRVVPSASFKDLYPMLFWFVCFLTMKRNLHYWKYGWAIITGGGQNRVGHNWGGHNM